MLIKAYDHYSISRKKGRRKRKRGFHENIRRGSNDYGLNRK